MQIPFLVALRTRSVAVVSWARRTLAMRGWICSTDFELEFSADHPVDGDINLRSAVVVMDPFPKWVYLRCPCGCREVVMLSLSERRRPRWTLKQDWLGRPTLWPSVHRLAGCRSHFWLRRGTVEWCEGDLATEIVEFDTTRVSVKASRRASLRQ